MINKSPSVAYRSIRQLTDGRAVLIYQQQEVFVFALFYTT